MRTFRCVYRERGGTLRGQKRVHYGQIQCKVDVEDKHGELHGGLDSDVGQQERTGLTG